MAIPRLPQLCSTARHGTARHSTEQGAECSVMLCCTIADGGAGVGAAAQQAMIEDREVPLRSAPPGFDRPPIEARTAGGGGGGGGRGAPPGFEPGAVDAARAAAQKALGGLSLHGPVRRRYQYLTACYSVLCDRHRSAWCKACPCGSYRWALQCRHPASGAHTAQRQQQQQPLRVTGACHRAFSSRRSSTVVETAHLRMPGTCSSRC